MGAQKRLDLRQDPAGRVSYVHDRDLRTCSAAAASDNGLRCALTFSCAGAASPSVTARFHGVPCACNATSEALNVAGSCSHACDVTALDAGTALATSLGSASIDVLIYNAGVKIPF